MALTPKQENFAMAYIETSNASEAYRRSYNAGNMKPESINVNASKLLSDAKVALRIKELRELQVERHAETVDDIARMLLEDRRLARELETPAAAVSASMGLAKLRGHLKDKVDLNVNSDFADELAKARERSIDK